MVNWIQKIIPQIKATKDPMDARLAACLVQLKEADSHFRPGARNMAGEIFRSIFEFKYAKPFMLELAKYLVANLPADQAERMLTLTPEAKPVAEQKSRLRM